MKKSKLKKILFKNAAETGVWKKKERKKSSGKEERIDRRKKLIDRSFETEAFEAASKG